MAACEVPADDRGPGSVEGDGAVQHGGTQMAEWLGRVGLKLGVQGGPAPQANSAAIDRRRLPGQTVSLR
jgi:hypothetical protein